MNAIAENHLDDEDDFDEDLDAIEERHAELVAAALAWRPSEPIEKLLPLMEEINEIEDEGAIDVNGIELEMLARSDAFDPNDLRLCGAKYVWAIDDAGFALHACTGESVSSIDELCNLRRFVSEWSRRIADAARNSKPEWIGRIDELDRLGLSPAEAKLRLAREAVASSLTDLSDEERAAWRLCEAVSRVSDERDGALLGRLRDEVSERIRTICEG